MKASDIMVSAVKSVNVDATIDQAIALMLEAGVSGLPVLDGQGRLAGMLSEGDLLHREEIGTAKRKPRWIEVLFGEDAGAYVASHARKVTEIMTTDVVTIAPDASLAEVVGKMDARRVKRLPVVSGGALVGIVTRSGLLRALVAARATAPAEGGSVAASDQAIRDALMAELKIHPVADLSALDIAVRQGVVTLTGQIDTHKQRDALVVAAENIAGVTQVVDQLVQIEPFSGAPLRVKTDVLD